jgi:hypothetical protein
LQPKCDQGARFDETDPESVREIAGSKLEFMEQLVMKAAESIFYELPCRKEI